MNNIASKVAPEYPAVAKQLRIQGSVELEATVAENGTVESVAIVSGNVVLTRSAAAALKKWKFRPFMDGGKPVQVIAPISMTFTM
ncbi:MAG: energy transducer TonB [Bryobacteraceae bacterium]